MNTFINITILLAFINTFTALSLITDNELKARQAEASVVHLMDDLGLCQMMNQQQQEFERTHGLLRDQDTIRDEPSNQ